MGLKVLWFHDTPDPAKPPFPNWSSHMLLPSLVHGLACVWELWLSLAVSERRKCLSCSSHGVMWLFLGKRASPWEPGLPVNWEGKSKVLRQSSPWLRIMFVKIRSGICFLVASLLFLFPMTSATDCFQSRWFCVLLTHLMDLHGIWECKSKRWSWVF